MVPTHHRSLKHRNRCPSCQFSLASLLSIVLFLLNKHLFVSTSLLGLGSVDVVTLALLLLHTLSFRRRIDGFQLCPLLFLSAQSEKDLLVDGSQGFQHVLLSVMVAIPLLPITLPTQSNEQHPVAERHFPVEEAG